MIDDADAGEDDGKDDDAEADADDGDDDDDDDNSDDDDVVDDDDDDEDDDGDDDDDDDDGGGADDHDSVRIMLMDNDGGFRKNEDYKVWNNATLGLQTTSIAEEGERQQQKQQQQQQQQHLFGIKPTKSQTVKDHIANKPPEPREQLSVRTPPPPHSALALSALACNMLPLMYWRQNAPPRSRCRGTASPHRNLGPGPKCFLPCIRWIQKHAPNAATPMHWRGLDIASPQ